MRILEEIQNMISGYGGVDVEQVIPSASLVDDLGLDSLDLIEILMATEEFFGVEIYDDDCEKIDTVQDAVNVVSHALSLRGAAE